MKHIKRFNENYLINNTTEPEIGDYVICSERDDNYNDDEGLMKLYEFLDNNVGKYLENKDKKYDKYGYGDFHEYIVQYENVPQYLLDNKMFITVYDNITVRPMSKSEIIYWSKNKEKLEVLIATNKYNI